ncbi:MAG: alpha/beta hydrolase [Promethearchaeota archaeon]
MMLDIHKLRSEFGEKHSLLTTSDGVTLFIREWEPEGQPRSTAILILHGITAYSGPYSEIATPFASRGFAVFGMDLRGHGLSDGNRGDTPGRERYVKDLCEAIAFVKERHPSIVILGHSLGVLSSILAMSACINQIDGAIFLSAARDTRPGVYPSIGGAQKLKILLSSIFFPSRPVMEYRREGMVGLEDPLFTFSYTLRFMRTTVLSDFSFPSEMPFPVLVAIGNEDELFAVDAARALFEEIPSKTKEFLVAEGARHAVFPKGCLNPIFEWADSTFK